MADLPEIPGYKFVSKLGEGGMAVVYLAIQEKLNRNVAIKLLNPSLLNKKETETRFKREARTVAKLSHSNIIQIIDTGKAGDYHYIIMEYLEESLNDWMKRNPQGKMPPEIALSIVEEIIEALDYAHLRGIYHRDIKPENIMFRHDSTPVLVDFGVARLLDDKKVLTTSGMPMGTVYYMSPEQVRAKKTIDGRSDIYSLGAVLYEMLTGQKPYEDDSAISIALQHIEKPVPKLPKELNHYQPLIDKMMAKKKKNRISTKPQFVRILADIIYSSKSLNPVASGQWPYPRHKNTSVYSFLAKEGKMGKALNHSFYFMKDKLISSRKFLNKKNVTVILGILITALLASITFLLISYNNYSNLKHTMTLKEEKSPGKQVESPFSRFPVKQENDKLFQEKYNRALQYIKEEDYEKAASLVEELRILKNTEEVKEMAEKVSQWKDKEFNRYFSQACDFYKKKNYYKAKMCIVQARQFKITQVLKALEENVDKKLNLKGKRNR